MASSKGPSFRKYDPSQTVLLPTNLDEWLPEDHLARIVAEVVDHPDLERSSPPTGTPREDSRPSIPDSSSRSSSMVTPSAW